MARAKNGRNGRLEEAVAILIQNQASFLSRISEMDRVNAERFGRIETVLGEHSRILGEHSQILAELVRMVQSLPETIPGEDRLLRARQISVHAVT